ncbi:MAG: MBL fold metallo-hydrolase [Candidatus Cloacimonadota bacterium]|nr:MAG: MBL fold metallo-hydrolase [Candidatus Cloacimonadota bacterium]
MFITCWGARGSIPISGKEVTKYGGDTACLEVRTENDEVIIIDAGSGIRGLGNKLLEEKRKKCSILFTHVHWDHIIGFPFFKPLYFKENHIHIYGCPFVGRSFKQLISESMMFPYFPVKFKDIQEKMIYHEICKRHFRIDSVEVTPIYLSHPNQGIGYKLTENGKSFVFLTDNELTYKHPGGLSRQEYVEFCMNADLLLHDSEYTKEEYKITKMWGHSIYNDALLLALDAKVKQFGLFHHNQNRSDKALNDIVRDCRERIKRSNARLKCFAVAQGMKISII